MLSLLTFQCVNITPTETRGKTLHWLADELDWPLLLYPTSRFAHSLSLTGSLSSSFLDTPDPKLRLTFSLTIKLRHVVQEIVYQTLTLPHRNQGPESRSDFSKSRDDFAASLRTGKVFKAHPLSLRDPEPQFPWRHVDCQSWSPYPRLTHGETEDQSQERKTQSGQAWPKHSRGSTHKSQVLI